MSLTRTDFLPEVRLVEEALDWNDRNDNHFGVGAVSVYDRSGRCFNTIRSQRWSIRMIIVSTGVRRLVWTPLRRRLLHNCPQKAPPGWMTNSCGVQILVAGRKCAIVWQRVSTYGDCNWRTLGVITPSDKHPVESRRWRCWSHVCPSPFEYLSEYL